MSLVSEGFQFIGEIYERRKQILDLTKRDFTDMYAGSFLGLFWAFFEPLSMMVIMWAVFSLGFRRTSDTGVPFVAYLFAGMTAFNFFAGTIRPSANAIHAFSFLVKKVKFRVAILPIVKINSALILHLIFLGIVIPIIWISGVPPSVYWFQTIYYLFSLLYLLLGLCWLLSALGVFVRDISHIVGVLINMMFWLTPIFWTKDILPKKLHIFLFANPLYYIVQGYRDSLLYHVPFWEHPIQTVYFWSLSTIILFIGILVFKKLRPHFADVL